MSGAFEFLLRFPVASEPLAGVTSCPSGESPKAFDSQQQQLASSLVVWSRRVSRSLCSWIEKGLGVNSEGTTKSVMGFLTIYILQSKI